MSEFFFETRGLSVGYDGAVLIRDITVSVQKGEIVTLIGPNGSGKTTILKSITRQLQAIAGTVLIEGRALGGMTYRQIAAKMAVMLTERMKTEMMTCRDVAAAGRYPYTGRLGVLSREDEEKVTAALEKVHALDIQDRDFSAVSDGQRQRVLLARALCQEPEILVLDEPTSFLDVRHKLELLTILRKLAKEKRMAIILSLHEIDLAEKISDKILCVKGDVIAHYGTPEEIFSETTIRELYEIGQGYFDPLFGSIELPGSAGEAKVMVLSAGGTGIPVYRRLQREGIPFHAGILFTNDMDFRLARLLAAEVIEVKPFEAIGEAAYQQALNDVHRVSRVIDAGVPLGEGNRRMQLLIDEAKRQNKYERGK